MALALDLALASKFGSQWPYSSVSTICMGCTNVWCVWIQDEVMSQLVVHKKIVTEAEREKSVLLEKVMKLEQMVYLNSSHPPTLATMLIYSAMTM